ncbi:hypothetical protein B5F53_11800 [Blautia sp. An249]|uniref:hypothetical protein n=1 Tax=Blautia sp. An249 TaxID=1965603 RepID=UPI000B3A441A|nr:hypothetical protein [Blautia sp. An249]OUO77892.1 hypothetical protein B5F53_11800 [Blautia sp. An249]
MDGTPSDLKPFLEANRLKRKEEDELSWMHNQYTMVAVSVAVSRILLGKKAKGKYPDMPFMQKHEEKAKAQETITEEEAKKQRKNLLSMLQLMQINFENNHKN